MEHIAADLLLKGLAPEGFADGQPIGLVTTDSREVCPSSFAPGYRKFTWSNRTIP